jgi:DNA-binding NtrC family response regulator
MKSQASIAVAQCRLRDGLAFVQAVKSLAHKHSLVRDGLDNQANLGYIQLLTGAFEQSASALCSAIDSPLSSNRTRLSALESLARLELARGNLDQSEAYLNRIDQESSREPGLQTTYPVLWSHIVKARLHLRKEEGLRAIDCLKRAEDNLIIAGDVQLASAFYFTLAQAFNSIGETTKSASCLIKAEGKGVSRLGEVQGQYYYAASAIVARTNHPLALQLRSRAQRLWAHQGIVSLEREMGEAPSARRQLSKTNHSPAVAINALGSTIDLAHSPSLLAEELVRILNEVKIEASVVSEANSDGTPTHVFLPVGSHLGKHLSIRCKIPDSPEKVVLMQDILRVGRAAVELERYREDERRRTALWPEEPIEEQLGALFISEEMRELLAMVRRVAATSVPVLITGETGTGKEVLARLVHAYSQRARAPFLAFNCTAVSKDMLDSQLFGHRRGAFTGAVEHFPGVIRSADRGTLLLDEIGDMPLDFQPKLLRFLESSEVHPIGESRPSRVDVRVIAATNARLDTLVSQGQFREDLYYRLNIVELPIPPLRERRVDIPSLANHYLKKHAQEYSKGDLRLAEDTMEYLLLYKWPGNVRQLANEMRRLAAVNESGAVLMPEHLSRDIAASRRTISVTERPADPRELVVRMDQPLAAAVEHVEQSMIQHAWRKCGGRAEETAALLGLSRKGLYLKRRRYQLEAPAAVRIQA